MAVCSMAVIDGLISGLSEQTRRWVVAAIRHMGAWPGGECQETTLRKAMPHLDAASFDAALEQALEFELVKRSSAGLIFSTTGHQVVQRLQREDVSRPLGRTREAMEQGARTRTAHGGLGAQPRSTLSNGELNRAMQAYADDHKTAKVVKTDYKACHLCRHHQVRFVKVGKTLACGYCVVSGKVAQI